MGEKKEVKVRLSTVVYLFIILVLVVALGVVYYLGFVKNDKVNGELTGNNNIAVNEQVTETNNTEKEDETLNKKEKILRPAKKISKLFKNWSDAEQYCLKAWEGTQIEEFYEKEVLVGDALWSGLNTNYKASSMHKEDTADYNATNLDNFYIDSCWCEGVSGNGIGEKIEVSAFASSEHVNNYAGFKYKRENATIEDVEEYLLSEYNKQHEDSNKHGSNFPVITKDTISNFYNEVKQIAIINGNAKTDELWENNGRVKKLKLTINNKEEYILELEDTKDLQLFDINYKNDSIIKEVNMEFEVLEVYSGEKYEDVCLTSIYLVGGTNLLWGGR